MEVFGEVRSLLQQAPSEVVYEQLCALLARADEQEAVEVLLPYIRAHMSRAWPDALRPWRRSWTRRFIKGMLIPEAGLAASCDLHNRHLDLSRIQAMQIHSYIQDLEQLNLSQNEKLGEALGELAKAPYLRGVSALELAGIGQVRHKDAEAMLNAQALHRLERLSLGFHSGLNDHLELLAQSPVRAGLSFLELGVWLEQGFLELLRAPMPLLRQLSIYVGHVPSRLPVSLHASSWWDQLEALYIFTVANDEQASVLFGQLPASLKQLKLLYYKETAPGVNYLLEANLSGLVELEMPACRSPQLMCEILSRLQPEAQTHLVGFWRAHQRLYPDQQQALAEFMAA